MQKPWFAQLGIVFVALLLISPITYGESESRISIQVDGAPDGKLDLLLMGMSIVRQQADPRLTNRRVEKLRVQGIEELKEMLKAFGYYNASVQAETMQTDAHWNTHYVITLGPQVIVTSVSIDVEGGAKSDPAFEQFIQAFPLRVGEPFTHEAYEAAKKSLTRLGMQRGYFDAKMTKHKVNVDTKNNSASIYLIYSSNSRYVFGTVEFASTVVSSDMLSNLNPIIEGEPYDSAKIITLRNNLVNSGYFDTATVTPNIEQRENNTVRITTELNPVKRHRYTAGIGFGTDSGVRGSLGWENRYINKRGHRMSAGTKLSQVKNSLLADYKIPFWSQTISEVGFNAELQQSETDTSESESMSIGSYYKTTRWGWDEIGSLRLLTENYDVSVDSDTSTLLIPSVSWTRVWADDSIYTKKGVKLSVALSAANELLLSDTSFEQVVLNAKYIHSIGEHGRVIARSTLGVTQVEDFDRLPSSLRFFAGGDNSIRGFDYESLGPTGPDGDVEGGRYLAIGSLEYENMFWGNWGGAFFTDFGNAMNRFGDPIEYSVGFGFRWRSPVGLIRVDIAQGLSDDEKPIGFHVVIGPDL